MKTLKDLLDNNPPSNYKEIAKMIMDEHKAVLPKTTHDSDISGSLTISDELLNTLKANLVGFGPTYSRAQVDNIIKARLVTWQAGGTGISPQTFIKLSEQARGLRYQTEIPKDNGYTNTAIPASHLLDQFLRHSDYYTDLPDTDIKAFISGSFIQLGVATELVSMLNNIWLNFCFNSANAIAISGITLDKSNPMGPESANNTDSESQKHGVLQSTAPALKIGGLIDFINDINVTGETAASADSYSYLYGISEIPEQLYATFTGIWNYLEGLDRCLSTKNNNAAELSLSALKVIESMHDILNAIVNRTRTLLSGRIEGVSKDVIMGSRDMGLSNIAEVLDSIAVKAATNQKYSVEELEAMLSIDDDKNKISDGTLTINLLEGLLENVRIAIMVERFAHIYIAERVPAVNNRLRKMREDSSLRESLPLYKDFFKALPVRITDKGLAAYIDDRRYKFSGNFGDSVFHDYSILNILDEHEPNDSTIDVPSTNTGVGIINKWFHDHKEQVEVVNEAEDAFSETGNESKGLLHDTEEPLVGNKTLTGAKDSFDNKDDADDSDSPLMSVNDAKDNLNCFIWAVELASKDGVLDISKYQGIDHASDQIPFNTTMSGDDASEDDEVRDLVRNFLRIQRSFADQNETQSAAEAYIRDVTVALASCRTLVHDRAKAHDKSFGDIHAEIRADRPTDLFSISGYKIDFDLDSAEMKPNLAINPLEVNPLEVLMDTDLDFDFDEEPLGFYDDPLEFDDESEFHEATVVGELRRLMELEATNNPKKGDM